MTAPDSLPPPKPIAFVVMPFASKYEQGYKRIVRPALEQAGCQVIRADEEMQGHIHSQMFARLADSPVVVADISGLNPNVFYELGVAHALHKNTLMVVNSAFLKKVPFDIAPYRVFVYPDPGPQATPAVIEATIGRLVAEIRTIVRSPEIGIPNPVMDFLASRSPVQASGTLYMPALTAGTEREIIAAAGTSLTYLGVTGSSLCETLLEVVENRSADTILEVDWILLDPDHLPGWRFLHELRNGTGVPEDSFEDYLAEERVTQRRVLKRLTDLAKRGRIRFRAVYYKALPVFWALGWDDRKWAVGSFAANRIQSRGLPVTVVSRIDPTTRPLFEYYQSVVDQMRGTP